MSTNLDMNMLQKGIHRSNQTSMEAKVVCLVDLTQELVIEANLTQ
jgi:precorrin isomerase